MHVQTILNQVEKQKGFVYKDVRFSEDRTKILVTLRPHGRSRPVCSGSGRKGPCYDRRSARHFEFVPLWALSVFFVYAMRRVNCPDCGVKVEKVPWTEGKHQSTLSYRVFLATGAKRLSWKETALVFGTSWDTVDRAVRWVVRHGLANRKIGEIEAIGVDEIAYRRGHKYLTLVYQIDADCRRLLYVAKDRTESSLRGFFSTIPETSIRGLRFICTDMWRQYRNVIAEQAEDTVHIFDRFHVMKKFAEKINKVRAEESKELSRAGKGEVLKHSRWCLLKRPENLTDNRAVKLKELLRCNLRSVKAYLMREDFQRFWEYESAAWAGKFLDQWCTRAILNWFRARGEISNGSVEGMNAKAKLAVKKAYGFKSYTAIEIALYHQLGKLPQPERPHRFC